MTLALPQEVARQYLKRHPGEAARQLDRADVAQSAEALADLPSEVVEPVLRRMNTDTAAHTLASLPDDLALAVMQHSDFVQVARWLSQLDDDRRRALAERLPPGLARDVRDALDFPPGTAGQLMDPRVLAFREDDTIDPVLERMRRIRGRRITDILVTDEDANLKGVVPLQELMGAEHGVTLGSLARRNPAFVNPMASRDEVLQILTTHNLASLPVVAVDGRLLGVLRHDALVLAAQAAMSADLQQMVGAGKEERALSPPTFAVKSRLPWLLINLLTAFAAAAVVGLFDATIARFTALAVLMPVVAGQSGNTGAQALAVTSRGLALREIRPGHWWRVVRKEMAASLANGIAVSVVTCAGVFVWSSSVGLVVVIGTSMVIAMLLAAISGAAIPIVLTVLGRDPATASSIILTTVTDITGFFSFLGLATVLASWIGTG